MTVWRRAVTAALAYFAVVFATGFGFAVVRERFVKQLLGARAAEMAEIPLMIGVMILAALWVVIRYSLSRTGARLLTGFLALLLLLSAELIVAAVRDLDWDEYLATRDPVAFTAYLGALVLFALMPVLVRTRRA